MAQHNFVAALAVLSLAVGSGNVWAQQRAPAARSKAAAGGTSLDVTVTDGTGAPLKDVHVGLAGALTREATTDESGGLKLAGLKPGTYRLRFDAPGWISLEREVTVAARTPSMDVDVMLTAAPPPPAPPPSPPKPARAEPDRPVGDPRVTDVADFADRNLIRSSEPQKQNVFGCTGYSTTRLLQIRDPLEHRQLDEADETLYVLAGDGVLALKGRQDNLTAGVLAVIPRGTTNAITRRSKGPLILISVVSGPPCSGGEK